MLPHGRTLGPLISPPGSAPVETATVIPAATPAGTITLSAEIDRATTQQLGLSASSALPAPIADAGTRPVASGNDLALEAAGSANPGAAAGGLKAPLQPAPAAAPGAPPDTPAGPARQLSPALVQLAHSASGNTVTVQLDPVGLGHVQVRIDRDASGAATVQVIADRPETLRLLVADQPHLHQALDSAGVATDGRSLNFALSTQSGGAFGGTDGGSAGGRQGGRNARSAARSGGPDDETSFVSQSAWLRAGVDITA